MIMSISCASDIYALCEAFPKSYAETLYKKTKTLLQSFVEGLLKVRGQGFYSCLAAQAMGGVWWQLLMQ
jgi:hypothetical protein